MAARPPFSLRKAIGATMLILVTMAIFAAVMWMSFSLQRSMPPLIEAKANPRYYAQAEGPLAHREVVSICWRKGCIGDKRWVLYLQVGQHSFVLEHAPLARLQEWNAQLASPGASVRVEYNPVFHVSLDPQQERRTIVNSNSFSTIYRVTVLDGGRETILVDDAEMRGYQQAYDNESQWIFGGFIAALLLCLIGLWASYFRRRQSAL